MSSKITRESLANLSWTTCPRDAGQAVRVEHALDWENGQAWRRTLYPEVGAEWIYEFADITDVEEADVDLINGSPRSGVLAWTDYA